MTPRLWIFDADGTLRRTTVPGRVCPRSPDEWALLPGVRAAIAPLAADPAVLFAIASNQDQVGYGHLSAAMAERLLRDALRAATGREPPLGAIAFCPHPLEIPCACRKPNPGLLESLLGRFGVPPSAAVFVGDQPSDRAAAMGAGIAFRWAAEFFGW